MVLILKNFGQATPEGRDEITIPPPDLSSHLFKNRIVYLGLPLIPEVIEILIAQLIFLQEEDPQKPIYLYINSTGVVKVCWETVSTI